MEVWETWPAGCAAPSWPASTWRPWSWSPRGCRSGAEKDLLRKPLLVAAWPSKWEDVSHGEEEDHGVP